MMILRLGDNGIPGIPPPLGLFDTDNQILGYMVCFGFFIISIVQLIGILLGDKTPVQVQKFRVTPTYSNLINKRTGKSTQEVISLK